MRVLLDANVLYPTILREILMGAAEAGAFTPLWSERILEEWRRAAARTHGEEGARQAGVEIALLTDRWPEATVSPDPALQERLALPDPNDTHVLAAAITGGAEVLLTANRADFPRRALGPHGITLRDPDGFLVELAEDLPALAEIVEASRRRAETLSGQPQPLRPLLKRARLPRLGKRLG